MWPWTGTSLTEALPPQLYEDGLDSSSLGRHTCVMSSGTHSCLGAGGLRTVKKQQSPAQGCLQRLDRGTLGNDPGQLSPPFSGSFTIGK